MEKTITPSGQVAMRLRSRPTPKDRLRRVLAVNNTALDRVKRPLGSEFAKVISEVFPAWCLNTKATEVIYILKPCEMIYVKVGYTTDLESRMRSYSTYYPNHPAVWGILPGGMVRENLIHDLLYSHQFGRTTAEWFDIDFKTIRSKLSVLTIAWNPTMTKSSPKKPHQSKPEPKSKDQGSLF